MTRAPRPTANTPTNRTWHVLACSGHTNSASEKRVRVLLLLLPLRFHARKTLNRKQQVRRSNDHGGCQCVRACVITAFSVFWFEFRPPSAAPSNPWIYTQCYLITRNSYSPNTRYHTPDKDESKSFNTNKGSYFQKHSFFYASLWTVFKFNISLDRCSDLDSTTFNAWVWKQF